MKTVPLMPDQDYNWLSDQLAARHVAPVEENSPVPGRRNPFSRLNSVVFPAPLGPDNSKDLVSPQFEADVLDGFQSAEGTRQVADLEDDII